MSLPDKKINEMARRMSFKKLCEDKASVLSDEDPVTMTATEFRVLMKKLETMNQEVRKITDALKRAQLITPDQMRNALPRSR